MILNGVWLIFGGVVLIGRDSCCIDCSFWDFWLMFLSYCDSFFMELNDGIN